MVKVPISGSSLAASDALAAIGLPHGIEKHNFPAAIVQGMLCASLFPAMIGSRLPGAVYMTQTLKFHAPICVGELVQAEMEVSQRSGRRVVFNTTCKRMSDGKLAIDGTALMLFPKGEKGLQ
eukprot:jgi/Mesvir1/26203/Mv02387-RA.1